MGAVSAKCIKNNIIEGVVCKETDLQDNSMKEFELGQDGGKVLIVKQQGKLYAVGTKCSHYGAPLSTGALGEGRVRCPWHGACFNLTSGDIEDFPGLDSLPCYQVSVTSDGGVKVRADKSLLNANKRVKTMVSKSSCNKDSIVIIGAGAAGESCAETLRQEGFNGRLVILSAEHHVPYDRVKVCKQLDSDIAKIALRNEQFYKGHDIELLLGEQVIAVDTNERVVRTSSNSVYNYNKLLIAPGAKARPPNYPGSQLEGIFTIRSLSDANTIYSKLKPESNVVVIGSSFVGMEAASFCTGKCKSVTVVGRSAVPFLDTLGSAIGERIANLFVTKGVSMEMNTNVNKFEGADNKLTHVVLVDGRSLPCDVCIVGIGTVYDTSFLDNTSVQRNPNGTIDVNEYLRTNVDGVYAAGDVASAPVYVCDNKKLSIGHWQLAQYHGHIAAHNILDKSKPLRSVPFFFSMVFGAGIRYAGYGSGYTEVVIVGDLEKLKFVAYYCNGNNVLAVSTIGSDPIAAKFAEIISQGKRLDKSQLQDNKWAQ